MSDSEKKLLALETHITTVGFNLEKLYSIVGQLAELHGKELVLADHTLGSIWKCSVYPTLRSIQYKVK